MRAIDRPKGVSITSAAIFALLTMTSCLSLAACGMTKDEQQQLAALEAEASKKITVVLLARDVQPGKSLTANDIKLEEILYNMYPYGGYTAKYQSKKEDAEVLGCTTTRFLGKGAVLMPGDIYPKTDKAKTESQTKTEPKKDK